MKKPAGKTSGLAKLKKTAALKKDKNQENKNNLKKLPLKKAKNKLDAASLKKLGDLSLKEKVAKVAEEHSNEEEAALALQGELSLVEKSNAYNQHQAHLKKKGNEALKKEYDEMGKRDNDKGLANIIFLMKKNQATFCQVTKSASTEISLKKEERWLTQLEVDAKWTEAEQHMHLESGRLVARECPSTWGCWEYMDTANVVKTHVGRHKQSWEAGQEYAMEEEDEEEWQKALEKDLHSLMVGGLGKGKSKSLEKGKGKGKGKTKSKKGNLAALANGDEQEEDDQDGDANLSVEEGLKKLKKARELLTRTHSNFEEALKKVQKSPYLSKASLTDKQAMLVQLAKKVKSTKTLLEKGENANVEVLKKHLLEVVACIKDAKEEAKELVQLSHKTSSKASKSSKK